MNNIDISLQVKTVLTQSNKLNEFFFEDKRK